MYLIEQENKKKDIVYRGVFLQKGSTGDVQPFNVERGVTKAGLLGWSFGCALNRIKKTSVKK